MTDSKLRELERQFRSSGSVEDEAAWLRERVRAGELEQSKLELAAYCGHGAASQVLEEEVPPAFRRIALGPAQRLWRWLRPGEEHQAVYDWVDAMECFGYDACSQVLKAAMDLLDDSSDPALALAVVGLCNAGTAQGVLAAAGEVMHELFTGQHPSPDLVQCRIGEHLVPWALGMEPPELRVKADDVFGDVTPYRKSPR